MVYTDKTVMKLVPPKLLMMEKFNPTSADHVFAFMANRLLLEFSETSAASSRLSRTAVRQHMRVLVGVHKSVVRTSCASDPVAAAAVAHNLVSDRGTYRTTINTLLHKLTLAK